MRPVRCAVFVVLLFSSCHVFQGGPSRPDTALSEAEFIDVYVALARAAQPEEEQRILRQRGISRKELEQFVHAYSNDLTALSAVFDSVVARLGAPQGMEIPSLPY